MIIQKRVAVNTALVIIGFTIWMIILVRFKNDYTKDVQDGYETPVMENDSQDSSHSLILSEPERNPFEYEYFINPKDPEVKIKNNVKEKLDIKIIGIIKDQSSYIALLRTGDSIITLINECDSIQGFYVSRINDKSLFLNKKNKKYELNLSIDSLKIYH